MTQTRRIALVLTVTVLALGGPGCDDFLGRKADKDREAAEFARNQMPAVQELINELSSELAARRGRLEKMADEMDRLRLDPATDADWLRWAGEYRRLAAYHVALRDARNRAFLEAKKRQFAPADPAQGDDARTQRVREAIALAEKTRQELRSVGATR